MCHHRLLPSHVKANRRLGPGQVSATVDNSVRVCHSVLVDSVVACYTVDIVLADIVGLLSI